MGHEFKEIRHLAHSCKLGGWESNPGLSQCLPCALNAFWDFLCGYWDRLALGLVVRHGTQPALASPTAVMPPSYVCFFSGSVPFGDCRWGTCVILSCDDPGFIEPLFPGPVGGEVGAGGSQGEAGKRMGYLRILEKQGLFLRLVEFTLAFQ